MSVAQEMDPRQEIKDEIRRLKTLEKAKKAELKALIPSTPGSEWVSANKKLAAHIGKSTAAGAKFLTSSLGDGIGWLGKKIKPKETLEKCEKCGGIGSMKVEGYQDGLCPVCEGEGVLKDKPNPEHSEDSTLKRSHKCKSH